MVRKTSLALAIALGVLPLSAQALGLGDIKLNSALNQYFNADIDLLSVNPAEINDVRVSLASTEAFKRAGVDRPFILTKLRFKPVAQADGKTAIHVSSRDPIREPFLNFLVEVNWPKGKLVREYTVLLDPPVTLARRPAPVKAPRAAVQPRRMAPPTAVSSQVDTRTSVVSPSDVAWAGSGTAGEVANEYGPTAKNDTLWGIAKSVRHDGATMQQMMMALYYENPQAFINDNINNLKVGQILRVPDRAKVMQTGAGEAQRAFSEQMERWQADRVQAQTEKSDEGSASMASAAAEAEERAPEGELKIATARPEGEGEAGPSEGEDSEAKAAEALQQELILAQEAKESALQESGELQGRVEDLESQLEDLQRLLTLKNEQLAQLQALSAERQEEAAVPSATEQATAVQPVTQAVVEPKPEVQPAAQPAIVEKPAPAPKPETKPRKREKGFLDTLAGDTTLLGAGVAVVVVLLALLWVVISRRRSNSADFQESILVSTIEDADSEQVMGEPEGITKSTDDTSFLSDFSPSDIDALQDETGEVDPLAETDVYIAYGRYQQAEELIRQAINKDPERIELKHKLFEILFAVKNSDGFVEFAEQAVSEGVDTKDEAAWRKVVSMGAQLAPEHDLFKGGAESDLDEVADNTIDDLDADLGLDDLSEEQPEQDVEEDTLGSLDLDDLQQDADTGSSEKEDDGLDFDLDFDLGEDKGESNEEEFTGAVELASDDELPKSDDLGLNLDSEFTELDAGVDDTAMEFDLDDLGGSESSEDEMLKIEDPMHEMGLDELDDLDLGNVMEESDQQDEGVIEFTDEELAELAGATEADETVATIQEPEEELPALDLGDDEVTDSLDLEELSLDQNVEGSEASGSDEINTKLDLARAYIDMGDQEGARDILDEVANEGNEGQRQEAQKLLDQIS